MLLPFALDEKSISGIVENVLKYGGNYGSGLIFHLLDLFLDINLVEKYFNVSLTKGLFALVTVMSGIFWFSNSQHRDNEFELLLIYLITLVALTCSVVDQYLAIPIVALARYHTHWSGWLYSIIATGLLLTSSCNVFSFNYSEPLFIRYQHAQIWLLILLVVIWRQWRSDELSSMRTDVHKNREL
jgi:hypothetical protein